MPKTTEIKIAFVRETRILMVLERIEQRITALEHTVGHLVDEQTIHDLTEEALMSDLSTVVTDLETRVGEMTDVEESAVTAFGAVGAEVLKLHQELDQALANTGTVPQEMLDRLNALGTVISDEDGKLSQAIAKNTPADTTVGSDTGAPADAGTGADTSAPAASNTAPDAADTSAPAVDADGNPV